MKGTPYLHARAIQLGFFAVVMAAWFMVGRTGAVSPLFVPPIEAVWQAFFRLVQTDQFWSAVGVTLRTILQAYGIAILLGIPAGYLATRSRFLTQLLEPVISGLFAIPITLFLPLFILVFGIGAESKVAYGAAYGFFPIALNTIAGLSGVDKRFLNAAKSMGLSALGTFRHVLFPAAFPAILTGLRIGFFICFASVLGGETISSVSGVGRNIALAAELMEPARMYAWIVFVIATALVLNTLVSSIENRMRGV
ncbi:MAG TPA: ABC transporter permease [Micropepsaceae bacterium]|jgi:ABC-type nitrate/sulfonate/bicarbonate transport system permease component|nr:ABC transporter permease [Micropepsaceae bacterium]